MNKIIKKDEYRGVLTPAQVDALTSIKNVGEATMHAGQEYTLVIEEVLLNHFGFSENDIKKFHQEVEHILIVVREAEGLGLDSVGLRTIRMLGEIAEIRKQRASLKDTKLILPQKSSQEIVNKLLK